MPKVDNWVTKRLRNWRHLEEKRKQLKAQIIAEQERLKEAENRLSSDGILSSIIQRYDRLDMPRGTDISDRTGNLVSDVLEKRQQMHLAMQLLALELDEVEKQIDELKSLISVVSDKQQEVLELYYKYGLTAVQVGTQLYLSERNTHKLIKKSIETIETFHQEFERCVDALIQRIFQHDEQL